MRVELTSPLVFNVTGYAKYGTEFPAGEQDVPDVVAAFVAANPAYGRVLGGEADDVPVLTLEQFEESASDGPPRVGIEVPADGVAREVDLETGAVRVLSEEEGAELAQPRDLPSEPTPKPKRSPRTRKGG